MPFLNSFIVRTVERAAARVRPAVGGAGVRPLEHDQTREVLRQRPRTASEAKSFDTKKNDTKAIPAAGSRAFDITQVA